MLSFLLLLAPVAALYSPGGEFIAVLKDPLNARAFEESAPLQHAQSFNIADKFQAYLYKNVSEATLTALENLPFVKYVEANGQMHAMQDTQPNPPSWGIDRTSQRDLPLTNEYVYPSSAGEGVRVYIVDTGIYLEHNDFGGRAVFGVTTNNDGGDVDCNGHGTHVAGTAGGTAYGVAKKATLVHVKVLGCSGSGSFAQVISGIEWAVRDNADQGGGLSTGVINLSLGGGRSQTVNDAVDAATDGGIISSVSAGNDNGRDACQNSPAGAPTAYTVASSTITDGASSFTNIGSCVNIWAPGSNIVSAYIGSPTATRTLSGTSMSAPHVAGAAALILGKSTEQLSPEQVGHRLTETATPNKMPDRASTPNLLLFNDVSSTVAKA